MNTDALESFAANRPAKAVKAAWAPPTAESFVVPESPEVRWVIGVDQSLSACGALLLGANRYEGKVVIAVQQAWKIVTAAPEYSGYEESLRRAVEVHKRFTDFLVNVWFSITGEIELVHEAPPMGGGRIRSPEASLLSSLAIRIAGQRENVHLCPMVSPQPHKYFICGNRKAEKPEHHAALKQVAADLGIEGMALVKNEATRDALSIALLHLTRPQEG